MMNLLILESKADFKKLYDHVNDTVLTNKDKLKRLSDTGERAENLQWELKAMFNKYVPHSVQPTVGLLAKESLKECEDGLQPLRRMVVTKAVRLIEELDARALCHFDSAVNAFCTSALLEQDVFQVSSATVTLKGWLENEAATNPDIAPEQVVQEARRLVGTLRSSIHLDRIQYVHNVNQIRGNIVDSTKKKVKMAVSDVNTRFFGIVGKVQSSIHNIGIFVLEKLTWYAFCKEKPMPEPYFTECLGSCCLLASMRFLKKDPFYTLPNIITLDMMKGDLWSDAYDGHMRVYEKDLEKSKQRKDFAATHGEKAMMDIMGDKDPYTEKMMGRGENAVNITLFEERPAPPAPPTAPATAQEEEPRPSTSQDVNMDTVVVLDSDDEEEDGDGGEDNDSDAESEVVDESDLDDGSQAMDSEDAGDSDAGEEGDDDGEEDTAARAGEDKKEEEGAAAIEVDETAAPEKDKGEPINVDDDDDKGECS